MSGVLAEPIAAEPSRLVVRIPASLHPWSPHPCILCQLSLVTPNKFSTLSEFSKIFRILQILSHYPNSQILRILEIASNSQIPSNSAILQSCKFPSPLRISSAGALDGIVKSFCWSRAPRWLQDPSTKRPKIRHHLVRKCFQDRPKRDPNPNPTCILFSIPFWIDF